jgi:hypothetical protein
MDGNSNSLEVAVGGNCSGESVQAVTIRPSQGVPDEPSYLWLWGAYQAL